VIFWFKTRLFLEDLRFAVFGDANRRIPLTGERVRFLILFNLILFGQRFAARIGFLLDRIFFPYFAKTRADNPVFIVGNFRSGSTFLQRVLAEDPKNFISVRTWEIYVAPSISQRKLFRGVLMLDRVIGSPIGRYLKRFEDRTLGPVNLHRVRLNEPEEDEGIFLYLWTGFFTWFFFPHVAQDFVYWDFDRLVRPPERRRLLRFYREYVKRHLFEARSRGRNGRLLSKNPSATPKMRSLAERFPEARFIYLYRRPEDVLPSVTAWFHFAFRFFGAHLDHSELLSQIIEITKLWYDYGLTAAREMRERICLVDFDDIVAQPEAVVDAIYSFLGIEASSEAKSRMRRMIGTSPDKESPRKLTIGDLGLTENDVAHLYGPLVHAFRQLNTVMDYASQTDRAVEGNV
jgi:hypothetical protein